MNPPLPEATEVFRANGNCICEQCKKTYYEHPQYDYNGPLDGYAVKACDGKFYHL